MRIRQIKPSYYLDKALWTRLKADTREFYIALWAIADDAGWFEWDVPTIGAEVYTFVPVGRRERDIVRHAELLTTLEPESPHLVLHPCGHAQVPKMPQHQRLSGPTKRVTSDLDRHERGKCPFPRIPAGSRGSPPTPDTVGNGNGRERERVNARTRETTKTKVTTEFDKRMVAAGLRARM